MQRPSLGWWATVIAGIALIAGVWFFYNPGQDDDGGSSAETSDESSEPAAPKQPAAPEMPAAAKQNDAAGAEAFARYHFTLYNYAQKYNDSTKLKTLYDESCEQCSATISVIDDWKAKNYQVRGGQWTIISVRSTAIEASYLEVLTLDRAEVQEFTEDGKPASPKEAAVKSEKISLQVEWMEGSWRVMSVA